MSRIRLSPRMVRPAECSAGREVRSREANEFLRAAAKLPTLERRIMCALLGRLVDVAPEDTGKAVAVIDEVERILKSGEMVH